MKGKFIYFFGHQKWFVGTPPSAWSFRPNRPHWNQNASKMIISNQYSLVVPQPLHLAKKSWTVSVCLPPRHVFLSCRRLCAARERTKRAKYAQRSEVFLLPPLPKLFRHAPGRLVMTNRKSTTSFPMSRWTAYVAPKPPKGAQKQKLDIFPLKCTCLDESLLQSFFVWKLSAAKLSGIHWPVYPYTNGWWGTSLSTWNFGPKWPTPFKNGDFSQYSLVHSLRLNHST